MDVLLFPFNSLLSILVKMSFNAENCENIGAMQPQRFSDMQPRKWFLDSLWFFPTFAMKDKIDKSNIWISNNEQVQYLKFFNIPSQWEADSIFQWIPNELIALWMFCHTEADEFYEWKFNNSHIHEKTSKHNYYFYFQCDLLTCFLISVYWY